MIEIIELIAVIVKEVMRVIREGDTEAKVWDILPPQFRDRVKLDELEQRARDEYQS